MKTTETILLLSALLLSGACSRESTPAAPATVRLTAAVPGATRATVAATAAEKTVNYVDWFIADSEGTVTHSRGTETSALFRLEPGSYSFLAVANLPGTAPAVGSLSLADYRASLQVSFTDSFNPSTGEGFVMVSPIVNGTVSGDLDLTLDMTRTAAKIQITGGINFSIPSTALLYTAEKAVVSAFLVNIPATVKVAGGEQVGETFINDASTHDSFIPAYVNDAGMPTSAMLPCTKWTGSGDKVFYAHPNGEAQTDDPEEADMVTKLVIAATFDGVVYYYPIALPALQPNKIIRISDIAIRGQGSDDPNTYVINDSVIIFHVTSLLPWDSDSEEVILIRQ